MWLLRDGEVLASLELAERFGGRFHGLVGRERIEGALLLRPAKSVHTIGMRFPIDVAFLDRDLVVLRTCTMHRWRVSRPVWGAHAVLETEAGTFAQWNLQRGDQLELKG